MGSAQRDSLFICGQWGPHEGIFQYLRPVGSAQRDYFLSAASGIRRAKRLFTICGRWDPRKMIFIICGQRDPCKGIFDYLRRLGSARRDSLLSAASGVRTKRFFTMGGQWGLRKESLYYLRPVGSAKRDFLLPAASGIQAKGFVPMCGQWGPRKGILY